MAYTEYATECGDAMRIPPAPTAIKPTEPDLIKVGQEAELLREMAAQAYKEVRCFVDRVSGEEPACDETCAERQSFGAGVIGDIRRTNDRTRDILDDLNALGRRLRSIG